MRLIHQVIDDLRGLPDEEVSPLGAALEELLGEIEGISFIRLGQADVVRHRIVREIVTAYDRSARARNIGSGAARPDAPAVVVKGTESLATGNGTHENAPSPAYLTPPNRPPQ